MSSAIPPDQDVTLQLTVLQLAHACQVQPDWVIERMQAGLLCDTPMTAAGSHRFDSLILCRARRMRAIERDFEANAELAALVADLLEQIDTLRGQLHLHTHR